jgi:arylsulfatase A-like enzyme
MVEHLDASIGRVLDVLAAEGLADNTLVVFTSDNGGLSTAEGSPTCNLPFAEGKGWTREGGTRVCQMIRWPGQVPAGRVSGIPVTSTDFYPTLLAAAGLPLRPEQHCDGVSLLPLLRGGDAPGRDAIYWHYPHYSNQGGAPTAALVTGDGRWKLVESFEDHRLELFDLKEDEGELRNLAAERPDLAASLHRQLCEWRRDVAARIPQPNPEYERLAAIRPDVPNNAHV